MVAVKQFVDAAEAHSGDLKLRRAQLRIVSPALETLDDLPEHLRTVVAGIFKEIEDRAFRPMLIATSLDKASIQATRAFEVFANLWPAVLGALIPWMAENPERFVTMGDVATDVWTTPEARRFGDVACSWFAAAQDARLALAHSIIKESGAVSPAHEVTIVDRCVVADFALMFGLFLAHEQTAPAAPELPVAMAKLAYEAAKEAFVLATTHRFADRESAGS